LRDDRFEPLQFGVDESRVLSGGIRDRAPNRQDWTLLATFMPQPLPSRRGASAATITSPFDRSTASRRTSTSSPIDADLDLADLDLILLATHDG
jgi:hypothetical protein